MQKIDRGFRRKVCLGGLIVIGVSVFNPDESMKICGGVDRGGGFVDQEVVQHSDIQFSYPAICLLYAVVKV